MVALPRSPSRGLIEAVGPDLTYAGPRPLPRSPSRGLIEAWTVIPRSAASAWTLFPGHQAGASLKQDVLRLPAPALHLLFPGHQAGASLKLGR